MYNVALKYQLTRFYQTIMSTLQIDVIRPLGPLKTDVFIKRYHLHHHFVDEAAFYIQSNVPPSARHLIRYITCL